MEQSSLNQREKYEKKKMYVSSLSEVEEESFLASVGKSAFVFH